MLLLKTLENGTTKIVLLVFMKKGGLFAPFFICTLLVLLILNLLYKDKRLSVTHKTHVFSMCSNLIYN
jgi:hypothetical protein